MDNYEIQFEISHSALSEADLIEAVRRTISRVCIGPAKSKFDKHSDRRIFNDKFYCIDVYMSPNPRPGLVGVIRNKLNNKSLPLLQRSARLESIFSFQKFKFYYEPEFQAVSEDVIGNVEDIISLCANRTRSLFAQTLVKARANRSDAIYDAACNKGKNLLMFADNVQGRLRYFSSPGCAVQQLDRLAARGVRFPAQVLTNMFIQGPKTEQSSAYQAIHSRLVAVGEPFDIPLAGLDYRNELPNLVHSEHDFYSQDSIRCVVMCDATDGRRAGRDDFLAAYFLLKDEGEIMSLLAQRRQLIIEQYRQNRHALADIRHRLISFDWDNAYILAVKTATAIALQVTPH